MTLARLSVLHAIEVLGFRFWSPEFAVTLPFSWESPVINLRTVVLAAAVAALPFTAMAASTDTSTSQPAATAPTTDTTPAAPAKTTHKKPVHHVSHKTTPHKKTTTNNTQS